MTTVVYTMALCTEGTTQTCMVELYWIMSSLITVLALIYGAAKNNYISDWYILTVNKLPEFY